MKEKTTRRNENKSDRLELDEKVLGNNSRGGKKQKPDVGIAR